MKKTKILYTFFALVTCLNTLHITTANTPGCCPDHLSGSEICCGDAVVDPSITHSAGVSVDLTKLANKLSQASKISTQVLNGNGCNWQNPGSLSVSVNGSYHEDCCDDKVTSLYDIQGDVTLDLGGYRCQANVLSTVLPAQIASVTVFIEIGAELDVKGVNWKTTCSEPESCVDLTGATVTASAGVEGSAAAGFIKVTGGGSISGTGGITVCLKDGSTTSKAPTGSISGSPFFRVKTDAIASVTIYEWEDQLF